MMTIQILRVFLFNKGHLILIGNKLMGRQSISQFAAFVQRKTFYEYDDLLLDKRRDFVENLFKKHLTEIGFKQQDTVLFFNDRLTVKVIFIIIEA